MSKVTYMETGSTDPTYNLAFEEYVLTHRQQGEYLLLWQNDNTIVVGRNQNTAQEIDPAFVEKHHINVVRRSTGGGAVYRGWRCCCRWDDNAAGVPDSRAAPAPPTPA